jgi:NAD(P)H-nitrite reductase large subunit
MTEQLHMETADLEARLAQVREKIALFEETEREATDVERCRQEHEAAIFQQYEMQCEWPRIGNAHAR